MNVITLAAEAAFCARPHRTARRERHSRPRARRQVRAANTADAHLLRQMPHHPRRVSRAAAAQVMHGHETKQECCAKKCPGAWGAAGAVTWGSCAAGPAARDGLCLKIRCCRTVLANTFNRAEGNAGNFPE